MDTVDPLLLAASRIIRRRGGSSKSASTAAASPSKSEDSAVGSCSDVSTVASSCSGVLTDGGGVNVAVRTERVVLRGGGGGDRPVRDRCHRYAYGQVINDAMEPYRTCRGEQRRKVRVASAFTGLGPERPALDLAEIETEFVFGIENDSSALRFLTQNFCEHPYGHMFTCARDFANTAGSGRCFIHSGTCTMTVDKKLLDIVLAGFSCRPYAICRSGRFTTGTASHPESDLFEHFLRMMFQWQPSVFIMENVMGLLQFCRQLGMTPIAAILKRAQELGLMAEYSVRIVLADGRVFLSMKRRRVWLVWFHNRVGGKTAATRSMHFIKVV